MNFYYKRTTLDLLETAVYINDSKGQSLAFQGIIEIWTPFIDFQIVNSPSFDQERYLGFLFTKRCLKDQPMQ